MRNTVGKFALIAMLAAPSAWFMSGSASAQEADDGSVEDIVVTAQRREQQLQDVPISVSAVSGENIERAGITDTRQLTQTMPSLVFSRANNSYQPTIRGVGTRNANIGEESNVAVYVDGMYQPSMNSLMFDLANIQRVEVLRGPQGTLFGRNALGGLVNVITPDPSPDFSGRFNMRVGDFGEFSAGTYVTGGITSWLVGDIAYQRSTDDGYLDDIQNNERIGGRDSEIVRGKLLFEPTADFRAVLSGSWFEVSDGSLSNQPLNGNTVANDSSPIPLYGTRPYEVALTNPLTNGSYARQYGLQTRYSFGSFDLETTSSVQSGGSHTETDSDGSVAAVAGSNVTQRNEYMSNEVRLISSGDGPFSWILGAFQFSGFGAFEPLISLTSPAVQNFTRQETSSLAAFADGTYEFGDHFSLTAGIRYTTEDREYSAWRNTTGVLVPLQESESAEWTYRIVGQYRFDENTSVFASYNRGFKSGVFNGFATTLATASPTDPETLDAFEIGLKSDPLDWLRVNASVFYYDYQDIQQSARDPDTGFVTLLNAAAGETTGAEIELMARPTPDLNLRLYATYLDAEYTSFPNAQIFTPRTPTSSSPCLNPGVQFCGNTANSAFDASGRDMIRAPEFTAGFSFDYSTDTQIGVVGVSGNAFYSSLYYWDFANRIESPSYTMVNGEISWSPNDDPNALRVGLWGRNLLDEVTYSQVLSAAQADLVAFDRPRSIGISLSQRF